MSEIHSRERLNEYIREYGLNPEKFIFVEDVTDDEWSDTYDGWGLALVNSKSSHMDPNVYNAYYIDVVKDCMDWCWDGWCGPVKYIRAFMPIGELNE